MKKAMVLMVFLLFAGFAAAEDKYAVSLEGPSKASMYSNFTVTGFIELGFWDEAQLVMNGEKIATIFPNGTYVENSSRVVKTSTPYGPDGRINLSVSHMGVAPGEYNFALNVLENDIVKGKGETTVNVIEPVGMQQQQSFADSTDEKLFTYQKKISSLEEINEETKTLLNDLIAQSRDTIATLKEDVAALKKSTESLQTFTATIDEETNAGVGEALAKINEMEGKLTQMEADVAEAENRATGFLGLGDVGSAFGGGLIVILLAVAFVAYQRFKPEGGGEFFGGSSGDKSSGGLEGWGGKSDRDYVLPPRGLGREAEEDDGFRGKWSVDKTPISFGALTRRRR